MSSSPLPKDSLEALSKAVLSTPRKSRRNTNTELPIRAHSVCAPKFDDGRPGTCFKDLSVSEEANDGGLCMLAKIRDREPKLYEALKNKYFRPIMDENWRVVGYDNAWLKTNEITQVLDQYGELYPEFMSLGAVPADFHSAPRVRAFLKDPWNYRKVGCVMNMDPHNKPGSHWVGFYAERPIGLYYYDSYGLEPHPCVKAFFEKLRKMNWLPDSKAIMRCNRTRHQYSNSECGMFSLIFVIMSVENGRPGDMCKRFLFPRADHLVQRYRERLFVVPELEKSCSK